MSVNFICDGLDISNENMTNKKKIYIKPTFKMKRIDMEQELVALSADEEEVGPAKVAPEVSDYEYQIWE